MRARLCMCVKQWARGQADHVHGASSPTPEVSSRSPMVRVLLMLSGSDPATVCQSAQRPHNHCGRRHRHGPGLETLSALSKLGQTDSTEQARYDTDSTGQACFDTDSAEQAWSETDSTEQAWSDTDSTEQA